jgi:hypothetical protein
MKVSKLPVFIALLILLPAIGHCQPWLEGGNILRFNGFRFKLNPELQLRNDQLVYEMLTFSQSIASYPDSCIISYTNPKLGFQVSISPKTGFAAQAMQVRVSANYYRDLNIRNFKLNLEIINESILNIYKGPKAIFSHNPADNIQLCPFTDKAIQYQMNNSNLWLVASNYEGCENVEWLQDRTICLYDNTLHMGRLYNPVTDQFTQMADTMKRQPGDINTWSFLIFLQKPALFSINRWYDKNKAALVFTNDADGESERKMKAVYYGSNDPDSPKYLTTGFIANNIKVTNTVFGASKPILEPLWNSLIETGNTIGYHTYSSGADLSADTYNSLNNAMLPFNVRTWIDHSWVQNPETLCNRGWDPQSPYYILDAINDSNIDYFWLGDNLVTNPLNSFTEPGRLPHRLYEFENLTRPLWFFGRAKMQEWEHYGSYNIVDMKHNLTPENLDKLLVENGLCIVYTHFFFDESANISAFFQYVDSNTCEIKDEVNSRLMMVDYYQKYRNLWVDTLENVFDRMIATENVKITSIRVNEEGDVTGASIKNVSDYPLEKLYVRYLSQDITLNVLPASSQAELILTGVSNVIASPVKSTIYAYYLSDNVLLQRQDDDYIQPQSVKIYNIKGQLLTHYDMQAISKKVKIPFRKPTSGVYIVAMEAKDGTKQSSRFTVIK